MWSSAKHQSLQEAKSKSFCNGGCKQRANDYFLRIYLFFGTTNIMGLFQWYCGQKSRILPNPPKNALRFMMLFYIFQARHDRKYKKNEIENQDASLEILALRHDTLRFLFTFCEKVNSRSGSGRNVGSNLRFVLEPKPSAALSLNPPSSGFCPGIYKTSKVFAGWIDTSDLWHRGNCRARTFSHHHEAQRGRGTGH